MKRNFHEAPQPKLPGRVREKERRFCGGATPARPADTAGGGHPARHSAATSGTPPLPGLDGEGPRAALTEKRAARWGWGGLPVLAALTVAGGCFRLASLRHGVLEAEASLNASLRRRRDLIASLLAAAPEPAALIHEPLERLRCARQQAAEALGIPNRAEAENELTRSLARWGQAVESDPGFRAGLAVKSVQEALRENANQLLNAARQYNQRVMAFNVTIARFPWRWLVRLQGDRPIEYFVLDEPARSERGVPREGE